MGKRALVGAQQLLLAAGKQLADRAVHLQKMVVEANQGHADGAKSKALRKRASLCLNRSSAARRSRTSRKTTTEPSTLPCSSRIGAAASSIGTRSPLRATNK